MARTSKNVMQELQNGDLPSELDYRPQGTVEIDWSQVYYNTFMKTPEYFESKFPSGMVGIPGFSKVLETMAENALSPLEAMELRHEEAKEKLYQSILNDSETIVSTDNIDE